MPKKSVEFSEKTQVTENPSYTAQAQIQHICFWGETASWSSTTLQQTGSLEQLVLQALLYSTLLDFCFGLFWFLEPNVLTTFAVWSCLKESCPKSLCCLLCQNAILAAVMCKKTQQHISAFPYGSKPYFCSCSLRSDTILCVITSHSDTTLNLTPMLSSVTSHAKGKHQGKHTPSRA